MTPNCSYFNIHNTNIACYTWEAKNVKAVVVLVHGMGEHALRYETSVIPYLLNNSFSVITYDNFGHGKTKGKRGHCPSYEALMETIDVALNKAEQLYPKLPMYLYGHSMGGNLVINYVLRRQPKLQGVIATSPFLRLAFQPPQWKLTLGKIMLKIWPSITLPSELDANFISRDADEVKRYSEDPLVHDKVSPMYTFPIIDAGEWAIANASQLEIPMLIAHGTGDQITDHKASMAFVEASKIAEIELFEDGYHELHHDSVRVKFIETVLHWLNKSL